MQNRGILVTLIFIFLYSQVWGAKPQPLMIDTASLIISQQSACIGDTIQVAITVEDFTNVNGFQFSIEWEANNLAFVDICDMAVGDPEDNINTFPGFLNAVWIDLGTLSTVTLNDGDTLLLLKFEVLDITEAGIPINFSFITPAEISVAMEGGGNAFYTPYLTNGNIALNDNINLQAMGTEITCSDTLATLSASATSPQTQFEWIGPDDFQAFTSDTITNMAGLYRVTAIEGNCTDTAFYEVMLDTLSPNGVIAIGGTIDCTAPSVVLQGESADNTVNYQWLHPDSTLEIGQSITAVDSGIYELQVQFVDNGCISTDTALVRLDTLAPDMVLSIPDTLTCATTETTLTISSSNPAVNCSWEGVSGNCNLVVDVPGTYQATVVNPDNGCSTTDSVEVFQNIHMPTAALEVSNELNCIDTSADLLIDTLLPHVVYIWVFENMDTLPWEMPMVVDTAGNYALHLEDTLSSCTDMATLVVTENVTPPMATLVTPDSITCTNATVALETAMIGPNTAVEWLDSNFNTLMPAVASSGGTYYADLTNTESGCMIRDSVQVFVDENVPLLNLTYLSDSIITCTQPVVSLNVASNMSVEITWTTPSGMEVDGADLQVGEAGEVRVSIENMASGCTNEAVVFIEADTISPTLSLNTTGLLGCNPDRVTIQSSTNAVDLDFRWVNAANMSLTLSTADSLTVDSAGTYILSVTNPANGCDSTASVTVTQDTIAPDISLSTPEMLTCQTPETIISINSNTPGASCQWENSPAGDCNLVVTSAGTYRATVMDTVNGCTATDSVQVSESTDSLMVNIEAPDQLTCAREVVSLSPDTLLTNVVYTWMNAAGEVIHTGQEVMVGTPGAYQLLAEDTTTNCTGLVMTSVTENTTPPTAQIIVEEAFNCLLEEALLSTTTNSNYQYQWSGPVSNAVASPTQASTSIFEPGLYTLEVTDNRNGCVQGDSLFVEDGMGIQGLTLDVLQPGCGNPTQNGRIAVFDVLGGTAPFMFSIDNQPFVEQTVFPGLPVGQYHLLAQDVNGCTYDSLVTIDIVQTHLVEIEASKNPIDLGEGIALTAIFNVLVSDITDISWFSADSLICQGLDCLTLFVQPSEKTSYKVISTDVNGCTSTASIEILVAKQDQLFIPNAFSPNNDGTNDELELFAGPAIDRVLKLMIFDRWGEELLFIDDLRPGDPQAIWDGTFQGQQMPQGVYVYLLQVQLLDGSIREKSGDFTIIR